MQFTLNLTHIATSYPASEPMTGIESMWWLASLAADESNPTCKKRFDTISVESTETNRRDYRELLFSSKGMSENIGGAKSIVLNISHGNMA